MCGFVCSLSLASSCFSMLSNESMGRDCTSSTTDDFPSMASRDAIARTAPSCSSSCRYVAVMASICPYSTFKYLYRLISSNCCINVDGESRIPNFQHTAQIFVGGHSSVTVGLCCCRCCKVMFRTAAM